MFRVTASLVLIALLVVDCTTPAYSQVRARREQINSITGTGQRRSHYDFSSNRGFIESNFPANRSVCGGARQLLVHDLVKTLRGTSKKRSSPGWCGQATWIENTTGTHDRGLFRWYGRTPPPPPPANPQGVYYFCETTTPC